MRDAGLRDCIVWVFESIACQDTNDARAARQTICACEFQNSGDASRRCRFAEHAFTLGEQTIRREDFVVGHRFDQPARFIARVRRAAPTCRVADADRGCNRLRIFDRRVVHDGRGTGGLIEAVTDDEILAAYRLLAEREGVFCEPASAAGVAGILKFARANRLPRGARIVCILTGSGLKDPDNAIAQAEMPKPIPATMGALTQALELQEY